MAQQRIGSYRTNSRQLNRGGNYRSSQERMQNARGRNNMAPEMIGTSEAVMVTMRANSYPEAEGFMEILEVK